MEVSRPAISSTARSFLKAISRTRIDLTHNQHIESNKTTLKMRVRCEPEVSGDGDKRHALARNLGRRCHLHCHRRQCSICAANNESATVKQNDDEAHVCKTCENDQL